MANADKSIYYYLILFAIFLFSFSFIPLVFEIIQQKITSNIPYVSLFSLLIAFLIYLYISIERQYLFHMFLYIIGIFCIIVIIFIKKNQETVSKKNQQVIYKS
jgi:ABC-type Na+ efflux pump permease subunit